MRKIIIAIVLIATISTAGCISGINTDDNSQEDNVKIIENDGMLDVVYPDSGAGAATTTNIKDYVKISKNESSYRVEADASKVVIDGEVMYTDVEIDKSDIVGTQVTFIDYGHLSYKCTVVVEEDKLVVDEDERCY
jgi:hypothetical protein